MSEKQKVTIDISTKSIFKFFAVLLLLVFLFIIKDVLAIFLIAVIVVAAISPLVRKLKEFKIPRTVSVLGIYVFVFGIIGLLTALIVPQIASQIKEISHDIPRFMESINSTFGKVPNHEQIATGAQSSLKNFAEGLTESPITTLAFMFNFFGGLVTFFVIMMLIFYMSIAEDGIRAFFKSVVPAPYEKKFHNIAYNIQKKIGDWVRGEAILVLVIGSLSFIGLKILGVEFALTLAVIAGILEIVPIIGPTVSAIPAVFIAFTQAPILGFAVLILYVIIQQLENHIIVPKVMEKTTGISPVVVILALLVGAKLLGILGIILAVPISLIVSVFIDEFIIKKQEIN